VENVIRWKTAQSLLRFLGRYEVGYKHSMDTLTTKVEIKPYFLNVLFVNNCKFFKENSGTCSGIKWLTTFYLYRYYTPQSKLAKDMINIEVVMGMTRSLQRLGRLFAFISVMALTACATTQSQTFDANSLPTQAEIAAKLAQASLPRELREQIIRLHSREPGERAAAAAHLGKMSVGAAPAVPYLVRLLQDDTPVQLSHYLGGGYYSSAETTPAEEASHALAEIGGPASNALLLALKDPHAGVRRLAAKALGQIGEISAVDFLINLLGDPDRGVRATAAIALGNYRHPMAAQKIMDAYPAANASARTDMIFALAHINDILAVPFLINQARDPSPDVRAAIMLALGKLRDARVIPALLAGLKDSDEITRANAAYALGTYYSPEVIGALINMLADSAARVREAAAESLTNMTGVGFGMDQSKWQTWWQEQRKEMQPTH
jgi:HEAT repeat protein